MFDVEKEHRIRKHSFKYFILFNTGVYPALVTNAEYQCHFNHMPKHDGVAADVNYLISFGGRVPVSIFCGDERGSNREGYKRA